MSLAAQKEIREATSCKFDLESHRTGNTALILKLDVSVLCCLSGLLLCFFQKPQTPSSTSKPKVRSLESESVIYWVINQDLKGHGFNCG